MTPYRPFLPHFSATRLSFAVFFLEILTLCPHRSNSASIRYDQSQVGEYNVQIHLKNLELYAILDDGFLNAEYDYDYTDMTEKPLVGNNNSTYSTTTVTAALKPNSTEEELSEIQSATTTLSPLSSLNSSAAMITSQLLSEPARGNNVSVVSATAAAAAFAESFLNKLGGKKCSNGYFKDNLGRCRRLRKPHLPFLQMVHTPGVIKSIQHQNPMSVATAAGTLH